MGLTNDIKNILNASKKFNHNKIFMNAASPGVISLFLSNSYYSNRNSGSYDFSGNIETLDDEILNALNSKLDINKVESFLYHFIFKYLFEGHYHD